MRLTDLSGFLLPLCHGQFVNEGVLEKSGKDETEAHGEPDVHQLDVADFRKL